MRTCCRVVLPVLVLTVLFTAVAVNAGPSEVNAEPSDRILFIPIDLGTLGGTASFAYAINNRGDVVGQSRTTADASTHAFLYRRGTLTDLYPLNSQSVQTGGPTGINDFGDIASGVVHNGVYYPAIYNSRNGEITIIGSFGGTSFGFNGVSTAINNSGQAVGYSYIDDSNRHAFVYSDGVMTDIGSFGGYSGATDINDLGEIVGFASETAHGFAHAFIYSNGVMTEINPFGNPDNDSIARGINNKGQVVGEAANLNGHARNGFIYWGGSITNLGTLAGGRNSFGFSINDRGQVVGRADYPYEDVCFDFRTGKYIPCTKYAYHAFLYDGGVMTALNSLIPENSGWDLQWALDINSRGQIVGFGLLDSRFRAYLLTPVPERCSATLAGCDLSGEFLAGAYLPNADLRDITLKGANLTNANLAGANLTDANLKDANLTNANLAGANLRDANLKDANLTNANLTSANLAEVNVKKVVWSGTLCPDGTNSDVNGGTCEGHLGR